MKISKPIASEIILLVRLFFAFFASEQADIGQQARESWFLVLCNHLTESGAFAVLAVEFTVHID